MSNNKRELQLRRSERTIQHILDLYKEWLNSKDEALVDGIVKKAIAGINSALGGD